MTSLSNWDRHEQMLDAKKKIPNEKTDTKNMVTVTKKSQKFLCSIYEIMTWKTPAVVIGRKSSENHLSFILRLVIRRTTYHPKAL